MGIRIDGTSDLINATDGSLTVEGQSMNLSGVITATSFVTADKIIHDGDTNTALRFPDADSITGETAGSERFRVGATGNFGIGSNNPQVLLHIASATPTLRIHDTTNNFYSHISVDDSGSLILDGDAGNGAGSSRIVFKTDGSEHARITSDGILGLGTAAPYTNGLLHCDGNLVLTASGNAPKIIFDEFGTGTDPKAQIEMDQTDSTNASLQFYTEGSGTLTERMRIDSSGRVLIGQTASLDDLQVGTPLLQLTKSSADLLSLRRNSADNGGPFLCFVKERSDAIVQDDDLVGSIGWFAHDGTDLDSYVSQIRCGIDGTPGANDTPGRLTFHTTADGSNRTTERMRIDSSGRVGIGTDSPGTEFEVAGGGTVANFKGTGGAGSIQLTDINNGKNLFLQNANGLFNVQTSGSSYSNKVSVAENGKVTIADGDTFQYPKRLNVQGESGSIVALRNWETTSYAQDTCTAIDFNLLTGNTNNTNGSCEIRAFKENGTNGDNARGLSFWTAGNGGSPAERMRINSAGQVSFAAGGGLGGDAHVWIGGGQASGAGGGDGLSLHYAASTSSPIYFNSETTYQQKSIYMESYWMKIRGHNNEGVEIIGSNASSAPDLLFKFEGKNLGGDCFNYQNSVDWDTTSDERIKTGITTITGSDGLSKISQLRPVHFDYTDNWCYYKGWTHNSEETGTVTGINTSLQKDNVGWIAQEYINVFPRDVKIKNTTVGLSTDHTEYAKCGVVTYSDFHTMSQNSVVPHLVAAIQELKTLNDALTARVATLESA